MRYPFKDQAKSSSETLIPVDLSPPMSTIRDKVLPYSKGKSFQLKIKTTATEHNKKTTAASVRGKGKSNNKNIAAKKLRPLKKLFLQEISCTAGWRPAEGHQPADN